MRYSVCVILGCLVLALIATSHGASVADKDTVNDANKGELRDALVSKLKRLLHAPATVDEKAEQTADSDAGPNLQGRNVDGHASKRAHSPLNLNQGNEHHARAAPTHNRKRQGTPTHKRGMQGGNKQRAAKKPVHGRSMKGPAATKQHQRNLHKATKQGRSTNNDRPPHARQGKRNLQRKKKTAGGASKRMYNMSSDPLTRCYESCDMTYDYNYYYYYDYYNYYDYNYDWSAWDYNYDSYNYNDYWDMYYNGYDNNDMYGSYYDYNYDDMYMYDRLYACYDGCYFNDPSTSMCNEGFSPAQIDDLKNWMQNELFNYMYMNK